MPLKNPNLEHFRSRTVKALLKLPKREISSAELERHRIFSFLLMALVHYYWTPKKRGSDGHYPHSERSLESKPNGHRDYLGHNIAALAVNDKGHILDFEFNHNTIFNSSAEHAEARLIRRIYGLGQVMDAYSGLDTIPRSRSDYDTFEDVTIYTSLESCSQCAGMMALARVKEVVYLQTDPGMYNIGNMLYNLTRKIPSVKESKGALQAPYPIFGSQLGIEACKLLDNAFHLFHKEVPNKPFFIPKNGHPPDKSQSITSFLCTDIAYDIFGSGADELADFKVVHGSYIPKSQRCPTDEVCGPAVCGALDNVATLKRAKQFYQYATRAGKRGTPHP